MWHRCGIICQGRPSEPAASAAGVYLQRPELKGSEAPSPLVISASAVESEPPSTPNMVCGIYCVGLLIEMQLESTCIQKFTAALAELTNAAAS